MHHSFRSEFSKYLKGEIDKSPSISPACQQNNQHIKSGSPFSSSSSVNERSRSSKCSKGIDFDEFALGWPETGSDGPFCRMPLIVPDRLKKHCYDLRGFGIPAEGLPAILRCFSTNGWMIKNFKLEPAVEHPRNENGCSAYYKKHKTKVLKALHAWTRMQVTFD